MGSASMSGILQDMLKKNLRRKFFFEPQYSSEYVLYDNTSYFATANNQDLSLNYFTVCFKDRVVYPAGYVIRSVYDNGYLRGWDLLGSIDGNKWTTLHSSPASATLANLNAGRYELSGGPFRCFKVVMTAPCLHSDETLKYKLRLTYLEFFGFNWNGLCTNQRYKKDPSYSLFIISLIYSF